MTDENQDLRQVSACADAAGERLDRYLASLWPDLSRARIQALMADGQITVDAKVETSAKRKVRPKLCIHLAVPPPVAAEPEPENIPLEILFEDEDLIVLVKPAGLTVHPAAGNWTGTLVNALLI